MYLSSFVFIILILALGLEIKGIQESKEGPLQLILPSLYPFCPNGTNVKEKDVGYEPQNNANVTLCQELGYHDTTQFLNRQNRTLRSVKWIIDLATSKSKNRNTLNLLRLQSLFWKIRRSDQNVTIVVLGGSLTAGRTVGGHEGSYVHRLEKSLNDYRQNRNGSDGAVIGQVKVFNLAEGGTNSLWALYRLNESLNAFNSLLDLVIVDYDVNDCSDFSAENIDQREDLQAITEQLVRRLLSHPAKPAVMFMNIAINHAHYRPMKGDCSMYHSCYVMGEVRKPVLDAYSVPILSQKLALWHHFSCPPPAHMWPCNRFCAHPSHAAHELLAEMVSDFLTGVVFESEAVVLKDYYNHHYHYHYGVKEDTMSGLQKLRVNESQSLQLHNQFISHRFSAFDNICNSAPLTSIHASSVLSPTASTNTMGMINVTSSSFSSPLFYKDPCWEVKEDIKDKPGFIVDSDACYHKPIIFNVTFGANPQLTLVYLKSYEDHYGVALVSAFPLFGPLLNQSIACTPKNGACPDFYATVTNSSFLFPYTMGKVSSRFDDGDPHKISISKVASFYVQDEEDEKHLNNQRRRHFHHSTLGGNYFLRQEDFPPWSSFLIKVELIEYPHLHDKEKTNKGGRKFKLISLSSC